MGPHRSPSLPCPLVITSHSSQTAALPGSGSYPWMSVAGHSHPKDTLTLQLTMKKHVGTCSCPAPCRGQPLLRLPSSGCRSSLKKRAHPETPPSISFRHLSRQGTRMELLHPFMTLGPPVSPYGPPAILTQSTVIRAQCPVPSSLGATASVLCHRVF